METKTTSFITSAPTMSSKVPSGVITSSGPTPTPQPASGTNTTSALNNNNIINNSAAATSIITAPLMSQQSQSANNMQKQTSNNVSVTIPSKPMVTTSSANPTIAQGVGSTTITPAAAASTPSSAPTVKSTVTAPISASSTTAVVNTSTPSNIPSGGIIKPTPISAINNNNSSSTGTGSVPSPLTKLADSMKPTMMNGGSSFIMKQPIPPVTILPPTPAATPPPTHKQPPQFPPQSTPSAATESNNNNATTTTTGTNKNSQSSANPPPPASANNAPVKQPLTESSPTIQKIHNQEKPTQPLPPQHQVSSTSSPAHKQESQAKDQQASQSENRDQKAISSISSSVTNPASKTIITSSGSTATSVATTVSSTPATAGSTPSNIINKDIVQSISRPSVVSSTATASSQPAKSAIPTSVPAGKKMETAEIQAQEDKMVTPVVIEDKGQVMSSNQSSPFASMGGGDAQPILGSGNVSVAKPSVNGKSEETEKHGTSVTNTGITDLKKDLIISNTGKTEPPPKVEPNAPTEKINNMNRINSANGGKKEEIGEDVRRIMEAIENAGLCGPKQPEGSFENGPDSNISNSSGEAGKHRSTTTGSKIDRTNITNRSNATGTKPQTRPGTAHTPGKGISTSSPSKLRPATASTASKKNHESGVNGTPKPGAVKPPRVKAAPASGTNNSQSSPATALPPKSATSGLRSSTSTSRVASARGNTAPTNTKTPNENKNTTSKINGADSCNASPVETETRPSTATGSRSTPRLRPSSSLYRPTASSALKGVSSAPQNSSSNHNLQSSPSTPRTSRSSTGPRASRSAITMGDSAGGSGEGKPATIREQFTAFSRFGNKEEDGKHITLSNCDKWMKQAKVIDGKKVTTTDTSICFKKLFKTAKKITFEDFKKYVEELAKAKKIEPQELLDKLANCGPPGLSSATRAAHSNVVDRLTDTSKYTGSHKERFDATGKGRGIEGRKDVPDGSGYVAAFKEKLDLKDGEVKKEESTSPTPAK